MKNKKSQRTTNDEHEKMEIIKHRHTKCFLWRFFLGLCTEQTIFLMSRPHIIRTQSQSSTHKAIAARSTYATKCLSTFCTLHQEKKNKKDKKNEEEDTTTHMTRLEHISGIRTFDIMRCFLFAFCFMCAHIIIPPLRFFSVLYGWNLKITCIRRKRLVCSYCVCSSLCLNRKHYHASACIVRTNISRSHIVLCWALLARMFMALCAHKISRYIYISTYLPIWRKDIWSCPEIYA